MLYPFKVSSCIEPSSILIIWFSCVHYVENDVMMKDNAEGLPTFVLTGCLFSLLTGVVKFPTQASISM